MESSNQENGKSYSMQDRIETKARQRENDELHRKIVNKSNGRNNYGWLIMGYVLREQCANCKHIGFDLVGRPCPSCGCRTRTGYNDRGEVA